MPALDQSLRYSYVYLFHGHVGPNIRVFDQRQMSVRSFYNVALSRLVSLSYQNMQSDQWLQRQSSPGHQYYNLDLSQYPELRQKNIELIRSSYHLNFSGFDQINRQDGLGAEFLLVTQDQSKPNNHFILDPMRTYQDRANPNIHTARYLSATAMLQKPVMIEWKIFYHDHLCGN